MLEEGIVADFALVRAAVADRHGNAVFHAAARDFNPAVATAGRVTVLEAETVVEAGAIDPTRCTARGVRAAGRRAHPGAAIYGGRPRAAAMQRRPVQDDLGRRLWRRRSSLCPLASRRSHRTPVTGRPVRTCYVWTARGLKLLYARLGPRRRAAFAAANPPRPLRGP